MSLQIEHDPGTGRFFTWVEGQEAELLYRLHSGRMVIEHTGVPEEIGGRGVAAELVKAALDHARAQGLRVVAACSYSEAYVRRHPEYADLLE